MSDFNSIPHNTDALVAATTCTSNDGGRRAPGIARLDQPSGASHIMADSEDDKEARCEREEVGTILVDQGEGQKKIGRHV